MDSMCGMTYTAVVVLASRKWADESAFRSVRYVLKTVEVCSLYKRGLRITPRIPNVNDERDPPVMKHNLLARFSKGEAAGGDHGDVRDRIRRHG